MEKNKMEEIRQALEWVVQNPSSAGLVGATMTLFGGGAYFIHDALKTRAKVLKSIRPYKAVRKSLENIRSQVEDKEVIEGYIRELDNAYQEDMWK